MRRTVVNFLAQLLDRHPAKWRPLLGVHYLTYACSFRCPHCGDGSGTPYHRLRSPVLPAPDVLRLLARLRRYTDWLVLTGGEPLEHPEFDAVLDGLPAVGYDGVVLTTRSPDLARRLPRIAAAVSHLVVSLDTLDEGKADDWLRAARGTHRRFLDAIEAAAAFPGRRYEIIVSAVAMPGNLGDLPAVREYARARGFRYALCPVLHGVKAPPELHGDPEYRRLFDDLIADKRRGGKVQGTVGYLAHMRDFRKFSCRPSATLAVSPAGDVFYPCLELGQAAGNLLEEPDLHRIRAAGRARFGPEPSCDTRCHSACALGFSLLLDAPASLLQEVAPALNSYRSKSPCHARTRA